MSEPVKTKKVGKWYFGGVASAAAASCTHPLDLLKVCLQQLNDTTAPGIGKRSILNCIKGR